jgi:Transposase DDE domain
VTQEAVAAWHTPATGERGGQPTCSAIAIETCLTLRLVFHQALRQAEGLMRSIADLLEVDIAIPDHTTLSRRGGGLTILPKCVDRAEPLHLLVDSTDLKICGRNTASGRVGAGVSCTSDWRRGWIRTHDRG